MAITDFSLDSSYPIALFPVRVETCFRVALKKLLVRVYPDEIFANSHDARLTPTEVEVAKGYWNAVYPTATTAAQKQDAWQALIQKQPLPRGAHIVNATTPTNLGSGATPTWPTYGTRDQSWSQAAQAPILPNRWVVVTYRGGVEIGRTEGAAITTPLALTLRPDLTAGSLTTIGTSSAQVDPAVKWTVDYGEAEKIGMAVTVTLSTDDVANGFDRLVVLGMNTPAGAETADQRAQAVSTALGSLLDAHHYSSGLALVPQGTPTNNTRTTNSAFPPADPSGAKSYAVERAGALTSPASDSIGTSLVVQRDGQRLAGALGIQASVFDHVSGADHNELADAQAMTSALWPGTLGYFIEQMMAPVFTDDHWKATRAYFVDNVQGRGRLPAFRVGRVPYGVLPVTSVGAFKFQSTGKPEFEGATELEYQLPQFLNKLFGKWKEVARNVPRVVPDSLDPEGDLLKVLVREASSEAVNVQVGFMGPTVLRNFARFLYQSYYIDAGTRTQKTNKLKDLYGNWRRYVGESIRSNKPFGANSPYGLVQKDGVAGAKDWTGARINWTQSYSIAYLHNAGMVTDAVPSESDTLGSSGGFNYIAWLAELDQPGRLKAIRDLTLPAGVTAPAALLFEMLRRSTLETYLRLAYDFLGDTTTRIQPELIAAGDSSANRWERLDKTGLASVPAGKTLGDYLTSSAFDKSGDATLKQRRNDFVAVLNWLASLSTAELGRLFSETVDVLSHRLDAWITSLAQKRLTQQRSKKSAGCYLGAYAFVENLRPVARDPYTGISGATRQDAKLGGGFIHAPSMSHAAAAAVLRNAYRSHPENPEQYAIDLSSERVRRARWILDSVRNGQPLGAVLGYQIERALHEQNLDKYISPMRLAYPLAAKNPPVGAADNVAGLAGFATESIAARDVVDGLRLRRHLKAPDINHPDQLALDDAFWAAVSVAAGDKAALQAEVLRLNDSIDAMTDLLLAESVFQLVRGNPAAATSTLESLSQGERPPDPEIVRTPQTGITISHRVAIALTDHTGNALTATNWAGTATPRAAAEPYLDGWVGTLFGDAAKIKCQLLPDGGTPIAVTLQSLNLRPLDFLALARSATSGEPTTELDRRVLDAASGLPAGAKVKIQYGPDLSADPTSRSFLDALELGAAIDSLLGKARSLRATDLTPPEAGSDVEKTTAADAINRAQTALGVLTAINLPAKIAAAVATNAASVQALADELRKAALLGAAGAYPPSATEATFQQLVDLATSVQADVAARVKAAQAVGLGSGSSLKQAGAVLEAVFGRSFLWLTKLQLNADVAKNLGDSFSAAGGLTFGSDAKPIAVNKWFHAAARVRPVMTRYRKLRLYARALGKQSPTWDVAQLPYHAGEAWVGTAAFDQTLAGRTSLVVQRCGTDLPSDTWVGLYIDEWSETIPNPKVTTGLAFHYDNPGAEAAQTVLLAVPPDSNPWKFDGVLQIVNDTLDLAKVRGVIPWDLTDPKSYKLLSILPMLYYPVNPGYAPTQDRLRPNFTTDVIRIDS